MTERRGRRRSGGREARRASRDSAKVDTPPYLTRTIPPTEILSEEALETIERNA